MKSNDKACRDCGSAELYSQEVTANSGFGPALLPIGFTSMAKFRIRVCVSCGLVEWFVPPEHLDKVKERFHREA